MDLIDIKRILIILLAAAMLLSSCDNTRTSSETVVIDGGTYTKVTDNTTVPDDTTLETTSTEPSESTSITEASSPEEINTSEPSDTSASTDILPSETTTPEVSSPAETETPTEAETSVGTSTPVSEATTAPPETEPAKSSSETTKRPIESSVYETESPSPNFTTNSYTSLNYDEVKGVWLSYLELNTMLKGKTEEQFRINISTAFDNAKALGLNTVYVHVRAFSDAFYQSKLYPWSEYVTGTLGASPDFDPLEVMLEEAHSRELSFQAWINPLRGCTTANIGVYSDSFALKKWYDNAATSGKYVAKVGGYYFLNPAYDEVIKLITDGAAEIVSNYDVDGIHIDDYFYPTTDASFDSSAFSESVYDVLSEFRFKNCDKLVKGLYDAVKSVNPTALFGVSCQGSIENNYNNMYADVEKWCSTKGYTDYIAPQIYYGFKNSTQPYETCVSRWQKLVKDSGIPLIVGLSVYKIGAADEWAGAGKTEWQTDSEILKRQLIYAREQANYGGTILYCYNSIFAPSSDVKENVDDEIEAFKEAL